MALKRRYEPAPGSRRVRTAPYGAAVYDKPLIGSSAERKGLKVGDSVTYAYRSPQEYFRGAGTIIGFALNDVVVDTPDAYLYIDGKNVFGGRRRRKSWMGSKVIRKEGEEIILYSKDQSKVLGRYPFGPRNRYKNEGTARAAAKKRERQIQFFKHGGKTMRKRRRRRRTTKQDQVVATAQGTAESIETTIREIDDIAKDIYVYAQSIRGIVRADSSGEARVASHRLTSALTDCTRLKATLRVAQEALLEVR